MSGDADPARQRTTEPAAPTLAPLTPADVERLLSWRYPDRYAVYDMHDDARAELDDPAAGFLAIHCDGELIGHVCTGVEARVPGMSADPELVDVGMGFAPDRIGRGQAKLVVPAVLAALEQTLGLQRATFRAVVAEWNGRARAAVTRSGFHEHATHVNDRGRWVVYVRPAPEPPKSSS